jgi:hypothetical protein
MDGTLNFYSDTKKNLVNNEVRFKVSFVNTTNKGIQLIWPTFLHYANELDFIHKQLTPWLWESCNSNGKIDWVDSTLIHLNMTEINHSKENICYHLIFQKVTTNIK